MQTEQANNLSKVSLAGNASVPKEITEETALNTKIYNLTYPYRVSVAAEN